MIKRISLPLLTVILLWGNALMPALAQYSRGGSGDEFHSSSPGEDQENCDERLPSRSHQGTPEYIPVQDMGKRVSGPNEPPVFLHQIYDCGSSCRPGYVICWRKLGSPQLYGGTKEDTYNSNGDPDNPYWNYKPVPVEVPTQPKRRRGPIKGGTDKNQKKPGYKHGKVWVPTRVTVYRTGYIQGKPHRFTEQVTKNIPVDITIPDQDGDRFKDGNSVDGPVKTTQNNPVYSYGWGTVHRGPNGQDSFTVTQLRNVKGQTIKLNLTTPLR